MSKKTRWFLFYLAVLVFLAVSYVTVVFALGYKYDFSNRVFVRTGSFRVVVNTGADVTVNGKHVGETSFLGDSFSKGRLLPRAYTVRLEREGYHPWEKRVLVAAGFFTDMPNIVLLPTALEKEVVATASFGFPMPEENIRTTKGKSLTFENHTVSVEWLEDTDDQPFHKTGDFETVFAHSGVIDDVQWYKDHEHVFVSSGGMLSFHEIDTRGGINSYQLVPLAGPFWYDRDENSVYLMENGQIFRLKL